MTRPGADADAGAGAGEAEERRPEGFEGDHDILWAAFHVLPAGAVLIDRAGQIMNVNAEAERLLGRSVASMRGADAHDLLHRDRVGQAVARSDCRMLAAMDEDRTTSGDLDTFLRGDGHLLPVEWSTAPIRGREGVAGAAVLFTEVTNRLESQYRAERELAELRDRTERLALLAEVTTVLTQSLEVEETLRRLGRIVTRRLSDWAVVVLRGDDEREHRMAVLPSDRPTRNGEGEGGDDAQGAGGEAEVRWSAPLPPAAESATTPLANVLRRGKLSTLGPDEISTPVDCPLTAAHRELLAARGAASAVIAPLRTARHVLGALTAVRNDPTRPFDGTEEALLSDIAYRAGLAIDNARLFRQQRDIAVTLQHHLLTPLPRVGELQLAARYLPAGAGAEVGGDWYDALVLGDGVTALIIGDVLGHDLDAVAGMAQLRNMLRSLAWDRREAPSVIFDRLDRAIPAITTVTMATALLARVEELPETGTWRLQWTSAGHPPPLLVTADGQARYLEQHQDPMLGTQLAGSLQRHDVIERLPPRSTVLLYTDGLIEEPGISLDAGLERLRSHATELAERPLDDFCDQIVKQVRPGGRDDIALLAMRVPRAGRAPSR
ncbi:SpoIIE family protein phosphatase [Streptomyces sp. 6N223]|uniref:SpoIIE family protein phosphatase n=1 Tax=Streptomyces sp. 6N223 TaxID=3457412 RepID=UPI003FD5B0ED